MRLHKDLFKRDNIFSPKNTNFESKALRFKKLLKGFDDVDSISVTEKNIDSLLNNVNRVKRLLLKKSKEIKKDLISIENKEKIETSIEPIVSDEEFLHRKLLDIYSQYETEIRVHGEQTPIKEGFVYIIFNPAYPEWIKAGMTIDYEKRLNVYNQYSPH